MEKLEQVESNILDAITSQSKINDESNFKSDNQGFYESFNDSLFLDQDDERITLSKMYIEPLVEEGNKAVSEYLCDWMKASNNHLLILYGDAGSGKSSLVAKIIDDAYKRHGYNDNHYGDQAVLAIALRKHCEVFSDFVQKENYKIDDVIQNLFGVQNSCELTNKILILDGFDELTVLVPEFDKPEASNFINLLSKLCSSEHLKMIITSRKDYFIIDKSDPKIKSDVLCWKADQVQRWCNKFCSLKPDYQAWTDSFLIQFRKLSTKSGSDKRNEILCVPFILYLCCHNRIDLESNRTVCQIYDESFRKILRRAHTENLVGGYRLGESKIEEESRIIYWQFAKEIAYQMFLIDDLTLSDVPNSNSLQHVALQYAKQRTKDIVYERHNIEIEVDQLQTSKLIGVLSFARSESEKGITFAHKSVYEYFAAVKLYEDYFADLNEDTLKGLSNDDQTRTVMQNTFEAFRYKAIQRELFKYLCELCNNSLPPFSMEKKQPHAGFNYDFYLNHVLNAMNNSYEENMNMNPPHQEYIHAATKNNRVFIPFIYMGSLSKSSIYMQLSRSYANLTWFLTKQGFNNSTDYSYRWKSESVFIPSDQRLNMSRWVLSNEVMKGAYLNKAILAFADFSHSNLSYSDFRAAHMGYTNFSNAKLSYADLRRAFMIGANLRHARLFGANLRTADLTSANLFEAQLTYADLFHADLDDADLQNAILHNANLSYAQLNNANLSGADLRGANLKKAIIENTVFDGARYSNSTNYVTIFPDGFNPEEHGMVLDNPVNNSLDAQDENNSSDSETESE